MRNNKNKGFTLVELLVVIAILAILATVSVVGYTSYIKNAEISNDQNLAGQLNQFSAAINADHTSDFHNTAITPENVWAVTNEIRELGGLDEIVPSALKYGHLYFKFDKDEDDNYVGGEYVFVEDKDIKNYGMHIVMRALGLVPNERPGFFEGNDGNLYFLIDTTGSNLAEAVRGFYTFDFLAEEDDAWTKFQEIVADAAAEGHTNISTALESTVFATAEGSKWIPGKESYDLVFHVDENVTLSEGTPTINIEVNNGVATPIVVPENVTQIEVGSLVLNADVSTLTNAPVVFEAAAENLADVIDAEFPYTFEDANGSVCEVVNANIVTSAGETVKVVISNYLTDFDIVVSGAENKIYNLFGEDVFNAENTAITENKLNSAYVVWDGASFSIGLDETDYEYYFSNPERKSLSSKKINWEVVSLNASEGVTLTEADKACVVFDENTATFTLSKKADGYYPQIASITVKGTVAHVAEGATAMSREFTIYLPRINAASFAFGGNTVANGTVDVLWGEKGDGSYLNTYEVSLVSATGSDSFNLSYDKTMSITTSWDNTDVDGFKYTFNNVFNEFNDSTKAKTVTMTVNVGGYQTFTFDVNMSHAKFLFEAVNDGFKYVGVDGANIKVSDLFKQVDETKTYDNVQVNVYYVPYGGESHSIENLNKKYPMYTSAADAAQDGVYIDGTQSTGNAQSAGWNGEFNFNLTDNTKTVKVIFVVTVDGVRASENYTLEVIGATNVRDYSQLIDLMSTTAKDSSGNLKNQLTANVVLLKEITMTAEKDYFEIPANTTFYGNCNTLNITAGRISEEGIINLYGKLLDTKVIGQVYTEFGMRAGSKYGSSAICAKGGASVIENCYVANCRSPLKLSQSTTVINSVFFGGKYSNIDIIGGVLTIQGDVITVNQQYTYSGTNMLGTGIIFWWSADPATSKVVIDEANGGNLIQYNFVSKADTGAMPKLGIVQFANEAGIDLSSISWMFNLLPSSLKPEVPIGDIFKRVIGTDLLSDSIFGNDVVNTGIVYLNKTKDTINNYNTNPDLMGLYNYVFDPDVEQSSSVAPITKWVLKKMIGSEELPVVLNTYLDDSTASTEDEPTKNEKMYADSANAVTKYWFETYEFVGGSIIRRGS